MDIGNLLIEFSETGICVLDINKVCAKWNDKTYISQYHDEYSFVIYGKGKSYQKVKISEEQAKEVIAKLKLASIQNSLLVQGKSYKKRDFIQGEIERVNLLVEEKQLELDVLKGALKELVEAIS